MNGGAHAGINAPDIQEFLVVPVGAKTWLKQYLQIQVFTKD